MAFIQGNWGPFNSIARDNQPFPFSYQTTDTLSTVSASGYFNNLVAGIPGQSQVQQGDFVYVYCSDQAATLEISSATGVIPVTTAILSKSSNSGNLPIRNIFIGSSGGAAVDLDLGATSGNIPASTGTTIAAVTPSGLFSAAVIGSDWVTTPNANAVPNSALAQAPANTFKGNPTGSTANEQDMTATQATSILNIMTGDQGSGGLKGLVPAQNPGDATKFLTGAGTFVAGNTGTVTSVGMSVPNIFGLTGSPITTSGTFNITLTTQSANTVWAGPLSGSPASPTFRALSASDIPSLPYISTSLNSGQIIVGNGSNIATAVTPSQDILVSNAGVVTVRGIQTIPVSATAPTNGQVLQYNGTSYVPATLGSGTGTVTSVGLSLPGIFSVSNSPVTTTGTLTAVLTSQNANVVFAGPTSGGSAVPTFRALVAADIPALSVGGDLSGTIASATVIGLRGISISATAPTNGQVLQYNGTDYVPASLGTGTVTSVGLTMPNVFSVANSPVTTTGTLAVTLATQPANTVWAGPTTGSAATPTFRALVAADIPGGLPYLSDTLTSAYVFVGNGSNVATGVALSKDVSITNTGAVTVVGIQGIAVSSTAPTTNQVLQYNGTSYVPATISAGSGTVTSVGLSGNAMFNITSTPVTTSGTINIDYNTQNANLVLAGPTTGSAAIPTFRALVAADIPSLSYAPSALATTSIFMGNASNVATATTINGILVVTNLTAGAATFGLSLNNANIFVGNGSNIAAGVAVTGDIAITNAGVTTIQAGTVTPAKLATSIVAYPYYCANHTTTGGSTTETVTIAGVTGADIVQVTLAAYTTTNPLLITANTTTGAVILQFTTDPGSTTTLAITVFRLHP